MNNLDEVPPEDELRTYRQQSYPKRLLVVSAGSLMHLAQAFVLFIVVFGIVGVPADTQLAHELGAEPIDESTWIVGRSEEHTSELQSLMRISYAVFCLKKTKNTDKSLD